MISPSTSPAVPILTPGRHLNRGAWPVVGISLVGALLIAVHLLVMHQGIRWTSPLLLGDWLFTVAFALATLLYSLDLGRLVFRPLLDLDDDALLDRLAALGLGFGLLFTAILCLGFVRLLYGPVLLAVLAALHRASTQATRNLPSRHGGSNHRLGAGRFAHR